VYLITGGLGGIGLALAEHFARTAQAKLILVGRTGLPERSRWPQLIAEGDPNERRLRKVLDIEGCGGEVLVLGADVTSLADMQHAVELGRARFGAIHGVIHSAGLIDDGLISLKTAEAAARVLSVKTKGALVLEAALGREKLDFFVVFSSVSSVLGLEGQVDYTAANAFLDAFAERKTAEGDTLTVAIGWNAWRETGMAVALAEQPAGVELTSAGAHPCLERIAVDDDMQTLWVTAFSRTKHWLLSEHVVRESNALIPGTGYLELARAGLQHHVGGRGIELQDVTFLSPFVVGVGEARELRLRISRAGADQGEFRFYSDAEDEPHVTGRAAHVEEARPEPVSLAALRARCALREQEVAGILPQHFMDFGARWANVERIHFGVGEALVSLALPPAFHAELSSYPLHPALMDMATGGAQVLVEGFEPSRDFFVPFAYGRVRCHAPLTPRCFSHVRHKPSSSADIALFDATVYDPDGQVLVEVLNFMMKRVVNSASLAAKREASSVVAARTDERPASLQARVGGAVRLGISTAEGVEAFERILAARIGGPIVASSVNLHDWLAEVEERARPTPVIEPDSASSGGGAAFARPSLSRQFVMPRNEVERGLAAMWRELLGVSEVGVHDDFFELGGTSLVALRLFNKIRKTYGVSLPLSTLFEAPNIEGCAKIVAEELGIELRDDANDPSPSPSSSPNAESAANDRPAAKKKSRWPTLVVMQPKGTPPAFFCIAGLGGNLNNLRKLAILAGDERPVYGLQPPGADDPSKLLYSVPDLAEHYLREVRAVQPRGPYFLGGYSGGGIAAFEMCHRLTAAGEEVAFLGLIDSYSPELPMRSKAERARMHLERLTSGGPSYVLQTLERRANYERYELRRRVSRTLRRVFPDRFRFEQVEDSWLVAQAAYKPPPWAGRATLFRARELGSMSLWTAVKDDDEHGWGRYLLAGVDVQLCPGDHNTMCEEPNVRVLAGHLRDALRRASAKAP
jgi:thioesterase domain-containing protein/NAD(P)-dependent dehydrogenase (short-subunit alcohol dehydrogenase family)/acyl carrier protein